MFPFSFEAGRRHWHGVSLPLLLTGVLLLGALAALYLPLWSHCWRGWWQEDSAYSHGILIPLLALFMIWQRRDRLDGVAIRPALSGLALVVVGLGLQLLARWSLTMLFSWGSFLLVALGTVAAVGGWRLAGRLAPPILFLTFMVPMWKAVTQPVVFGAQMASTALAAVFLRGVGFEVQQLGTVLRLEQYTLQVAVACSGFKTLIALTAFASCYVYVLRGSLAKKLLLFTAAVLFSLLANGLRIALVGVTGELIDEASAKWVHDNGGLPVTVLALGGLFLMARWMRLQMTEGGPAAGEHPVLAALRDRAPGIGRGCAVVVGLVAAAALFAWRMPTVHAEAQANPVAARELPMQLGEWKGIEQPVSAETRRALPSASLLSRQYRSQWGAADLSIVTGADGTALHDPHDCVVGDGWEFVSDRPRTIDLGDGRGTIRVRDVVMTKEGVQARMWYWYALNNQVFTDALPARLALYRERLLQGRRPRAEFVRLIVGGETASARTEKMLLDLTRQIVGR